MCEKLLLIANLLANNEKLQLINFQGFNSDWLMYKQPVNVEQHWGKLGNHPQTIGEYDISIEINTLIL